jgi:hypothetical protein
MQVQNKIFIKNEEAWISWMSRFMTNSRSLSKSDLQEHFKCWKQSVIYHVGFVYYGKTVKLHVLKLLSALPPFKLNQTDIICGGNIFRFY